MPQPTPPHVSIVSFSVSPDDGSGSGPEAVPMWKISDIIINCISDNFYLVLCV